MTEFDVVCDRCGEMVRVHRIEHWTAGAYDMSAPAWRQFAREGERYVCTPCMHADPDYRAAYGGGPAILFSGPEEIYGEEPEMIEVFEVFVKHGDGGLERLGWAERCEGVWVGFRPDESHPDGPLTLALALRVDGEGALEPRLAGVRSAIRAALAAGATVRGLREALREVYEAWVEENRLTDEDEKYEG